MTTSLKKIISISFFSLFASLAFAPQDKSIVIFENTPIEPYKELMYAMGMVETSNDTLAYNPFEEAVGFLQIRPVRIEDYNARTGSNYSINDMYDYKISEKVFMYYASLIGPYNFERIARNWNGSGKMTIQYWEQVKKLL